MKYNNFTEKNLMRFVRNTITLKCGAESLHHMQYVQGYTRILAEQYAKLYPRSKMTPSRIEMIVQAAELHDIGKIALPDFVLNRPGMLLKNEMELLKGHTVQGGKIVRNMFGSEDSEYSRICYNICLYHHEKYDGSGYPFSLKKDRIPVEAQVVGLADMYDVLANPSTKRDLFSKHQVYHMLIGGSFGELSPRMKECLTAAKNQLEEYCIEG